MRCESWHVPESSEEMKTLASAGSHQWRASVDIRVLAEPVEQRGVFLQCIPCYKLASIYSSKISRDIDSAAEAETIHLNVR